MVAASSMATRSSLELMLDKLQQIDREQPETVRPALPVRPVSRARLPQRRPPPQLMRNSQENGECAKEEVHFLNKTKESGNLKGGAEKGICKIQKCYRSHRFRCCYRELRKGAIALQSLIRGENARRGYEQRCRILRAIIIIQKQGRKYLEQQAAVKHLQSGSLDPKHPNQITKDQTRIPYTSLLDLQKRVVKTEAKLREKEEENVTLKRKLFEMEKKWHECEERMTFMEKEWQDQLTYIQESLAAAKKNPSPHPRSSNRFQNSEILTVASGIPNGRSLQIPINSNYNGADEEDDEVIEEQICLKLRPREELRRLKLGFKEWKKEYKNKLRDAQSAFKKIGNAETFKRQKNWWGRLSNY